MKIVNSFLLSSTSDALKYISQRFWTHTDHNRKWKNGAKKVEASASESSRAVNCEASDNHRHTMPLFYGQNNKRKQNIMDKVGKTIWSFGQQHSQTESCATAVCILCCRTLFAVVNFCGLRVFLWLHHPVIIRPESHRHQLPCRHLSPSSVAL